MNSPLISIIIITLNEERTIESTLIALKRSIEKIKDYKGDAEIIVSDGGSTDDTQIIAKRFADKIITANKGRSNQLNAGALAAKGNYYLFLHADTILPSDGIIRLYNNLKSGEYVGGGFKKYWQWRRDLARSSFVKLLSYLWQGIGNWIVRLVKIYPGDNAIFVRSDIFEALNGFSNMWICEDLDFTKRLKKFGKERIAYIRSPVYTSTRRYEKYGFIRLNIIWFFIFVYWSLGITISKLRVIFKNYLIEPEHIERKYLRW